MSRIDFAFGAQHRLRTACEVVHKHYLAGRRLIIYTQDTQRLDYFDRLLWGYDATAFIPHARSDDPESGAVPVILTSTAPAQALGNPPDVNTWLLNLDMDCPPDARDFSRILEIVSNHEQDRAAARVRWRNYLQAGHDLHAHDLSSVHA